MNFGFIIFDLAPAENMEERNNFLHVAKIKKIPTKVDIFLMAPHFRALMRSSTSQY